MVGLATQRLLHQCGIRTSRETCSRQQKAYRKLDGKASKQVPESLQTALPSLSKLLAPRSLDY